MALPVNNLESTILREEIRDPVGPEFMAPPARS